MRALESGRFETEEISGGWEDDDDDAVFVVGSWLCRNRVRAEVDTRCSLNGFSVRDQ